MKKLFSLYIFLFSVLFSAQTDYSTSWEDFYSYNNVKDFVKVENIMYALVDNAVFTYDVFTDEINKLSSVQGLSGETTTSIYYNNTYKRLVIGYENGLVEVVDEDNTITISSDIVNFNQSGEKSINHISSFGDKIYLSTPFAIVVYDIEKLEFGDTFFIGSGSSSIKINQTIIFNDQIYAATENGIFTADVANNLLIDFNNWTQQFPGRNFTNITSFNNQVFATEGLRLHRFEGSNLDEIKSFSQNIQSLKSSSTHLSIAFNSNAVILDLDLKEVTQFTKTIDFDFTLNTVFFEDNTVFLGTQEFGILSTDVSQSSSYTEIHPEGPLSNDVFSIAAQNNTFWLVYGGYDRSSYVPAGKRQGFSNYNGTEWINTTFSADFPIKDLVDIAINPNQDTNVFIGSFAQTNDGNVISGGGLLEVQDNEVSMFYNSQNSPLEKVVSTNPNYISTRISGVAFDNQGNLWVADALGANKLKKLSTNGTWSSIDLSSLQTNEATETNIIVTDNSNSVWMATRRNGVYIFNENGNRKRALVATPNLGNLPDVNVRALAVDGNNRVWIGTQSGMVVYNNAFGVFDEEVLNANPVIIEENGIGERLLGDQTINAIEIDGAENKWFGTDSGGVLYTNPSGQTTIANFSTENSPLPSNRILKISVDDSLGKVYFATDKGIVAYNSNVAPFGDVLEEVYAYPNPALRNHETVTINGRNGTNLPKNTNVKILDVAGNLVYETNVVEGQELQGGKVVWNKTNLAGTRVASGIYIVLLSNDDASESTFTKIAIVN